MDVTAMRELLVHWANINSGSTHFAGLERMRAALAAEFARLPHASIEHVTLEGSAAKALRVVIRPSAPLQLLCSGHYDTVYGAHHAFQSCTTPDEQTLRGPGVADMKGGIVVMLATLRETLARPGCERLGFEVLLTPDEETGSVASRPVIEATAQSRRHRLALVFEPARANGDIVRCRKGTGVFTITCHGRAAHAGRDPGAGRNAILALTEYLTQAAELGKDLEGVMVNVANIHGGGAVNIVPDFAEAQINVRISRRADEAEVRDCLEGFAEPINAREGLRVVVTGGFNHPPKEVTPLEEKLLGEWQRSALAVGVKLAWQDVAGGSDGSLIAAMGMPCLDGLGPVGDHLHSPEEFIRIPTLVERTNVAVRFLERVARGEVELSRPTGG